MRAFNVSPAILFEAIYYVVCTGKHHLSVAALSLMPAAQLLLSWCFIPSTALDIQYFMVHVHGSCPWTLTDFLRNFILNLMP